MMDNLREQLRARIAALQLSNSLATALEAAIGLLAILFVAILAQRVVTAIVQRLVPLLVGWLNVDQHARWCRAIQERMVAQRSAHIVGTLLFHSLVPLVLSEYPQVLIVIRNLIEGYVVLVTTIAVNSLLGAIGDALSGEHDSNSLPIRILTQAAQILVGVVGFILIISVVFDKSVTVLLSATAGMTAVLMLLFKDSILGFVAGIQLSSNDMLRIGDWIDVPQYGGNGIVKDVRLTTVKVQNFDKTITTVPTYALVSESFKNWRGMQESGTRRIKRAITIDMSTDGLLTDDQAEQLRKVTLLQSYLENQLAEIKAYNETFAAGDSESPNARRLTNLGTFRVYLEKYLERHAALSQQLVVLVRHLPPTAEGLPIELYAFSEEQDWEEYERIQSDIFDHILAILPLFGLQVFQLAPRIEVGASARRQL